MASSVNIESPISLRQLEPSPVEETPIENSIDSYFPTQPKSPPRSSTSFLGLGDHTPAFYLIRLQKYSSYAFSVFTVLHITNTSLIPLITQSVPAADNYLLLTRPYYQSRPFEPVLVAGALLVHIASGLALRVYRRQQSLRRYGAESDAERSSIQWPPVSGISLLGFASVCLVGGHGFVNRVLPLWYEGSSANVGLEYVAHGFARHPAVSFVGFTVLVTTALSHMTWGWAKWLGYTPAQVAAPGHEGVVRRKKRWYLINGAALVGALVWLAGGLGVVGKGGQTVGWQAAVYDSLYRRIPILGKWY